MATLPKTIRCGACDERVDLVLGVAACDCGVNTAVCADCGHRWTRGVHVRLGVAVGGGDRPEFAQRCRPCRTLRRRRLDTARKRASRGGDLSACPHVSAPTTHPAAAEAPSARHGSSDGAIQTTDAMEARR